MVKKVVTLPNIGRGFDVDTVGKKINVNVDGSSVVLNSNDEVSLHQDVETSLSQTLNGASYTSTQDTATLTYTRVDGSTLELDVSELLSTGSSKYVSIQDGGTNLGNHENDATSGLGEGTVAIGPNVTVYSDESIVIGYNSVSNAVAPKMDGSGDYKQPGDIVIGSGASSVATAYGTGGLAFINEPSVVIGYESKSSGPSGGGVAIGAKASSNTFAGTAIGDNALVDGSEGAQGFDNGGVQGGGVAIGVYAKSVYDGGSRLEGDTATPVAVGALSEATADGATSFGESSKASSLRSSSFGSAAKATKAYGVALGAKSVADRDPMSPGAATSSTASVADGTVYAAEAASAESKLLVSSTVKGAHGAASVGANTHNRQIQNVAAGSEDSDAVNVAQLKAAVSAMEEPVLANLYVSATTGDDSNEGTMQAPLRSLDRALAVVNPRSSTTIWLDAIGDSGEAAIYSLNDRHKIDSATVTFRAYNEINSTDLIDTLECLRGNGLEVKPYYIESPEVYRPVISSKFRWAMLGDDLYSHNLGGIDADEGSVVSFMGVALEVPLSPGDILDEFVATSVLFGGGKFNFRGVDLIDGLSEYATVTSLYKASPGGVASLEFSRTELRWFNRSPESEAFIDVGDGFVSMYIGDSANSPVVSNPGTTCSYSETPKAGNLYGRTSSPGFLNGNLTHFKEVE